MTIRTIYLECGMETLSENEAYKEYNSYLNELQPLEGFACNSFSILLAVGDPIAYHCGFNDFCAMQDSKN